MADRPEIDDLYAAFAATLPAALAGPAVALAATLGLAPSPAVPWSEVFAHEITLGAPRLVAEAMPELPDALVRDATLAHLLAVIEAFGTDRIEDGQVPETTTLAAVLAHARRARDEALARVTQESSYQPAERATLVAIHAEQAALRDVDGVPFPRYLAIVHGKQRVGLPASLALARAAGWDARRVRTLARLLDAVSEALQLHDDVIDWEDDLGRGGAWAASLAAHVAARGEARDRPTKPVSMKTLVHQSGMLARMLEISARRFRAARRRAEALGASRLASWAREREASARDLFRREAESPGFANRAHALSAWARTVLP
jgi:hypothetical protein